jgi:hypothetical protein
MSVIDKPPTGDEPETVEVVPSDARPLPFVLRVAARWEHLGGWPTADDGPLLFRRRAPVTGCLALTSEGGDVQFSDLGV